MSPFRTRCLLDATFKCERWKIERKNLWGSVWMRCADMQRNIKRYTLYIFSYVLGTRTRTQPRPKRILEKAVADALSSFSSCWSLIKQHHSKEPIQWTNGTTLALGINLRNPGWCHLAECCLHQHNRAAPAAWTAYIDVSVSCRDLFFSVASSSFHYSRTGDIKRLAVSEHHSDLCQMLTVEC